MVLCGVRPIQESSRAQPTRFCVPRGRIYFLRTTGSADLPGIALGTPMTYLLDGQQYIALTVRPPGADALPEFVALSLP